MRMKHLDFRSLLTNFGSLALMWPNCTTIEKGMRLSLCLTALTVLASGFAAADVPDGYELVYSSNFADDDSKSGFAFSDANAWRLGKAGDNDYLELFKGSEYKPAVRSPYNLGLIATQKFGDFVMEADLLQTGGDYGHRDMCLFFGFQDPSHYYYVHISSQSDNAAHQIFIVNDKPRTKISITTTKGIDWGRNVWRKVRLERSLSDGTVKVFFEDMDKPIMTAEDKSFGAGFLGFGSFDDSGRVANVKIWAPESHPVDGTPDLFPKN